MASAPASASGRSQTRLLDLQRSAGNAAVIRLLAGREPSAAVVQREHLFASTMEIARRLLKSRTFRVSQGRVRVTANAAYEQRGTPPVSERDYHVTLVQEGVILDSEYGTAAFSQGRPVSRQWTDLPDGEYHLIIFTNNTNPYQVLVGDIVVEQSAGLTGESATQAPPGPLEILHTALDVAGLVPALGAVPDAVNAGLYLIEGDYAAAGLSAVAIVPVFGDAATVARLGGRAVVRVSGEAVERVGREGIEAGLRRARAHPAVDPDIAARVERGIVEEAGTSTGPARRPRLTPPGTRGAAEAARRTFDGLRDAYAARLGVPAGGQVHHAVELQVLDRYPGAFVATELNDFANMRGIATELQGRLQLHNSAIRRTWDRHYRALDSEIAARGLQPGTAEYTDYARRYLDSGREEIDHVLGQFFTEYRSAVAAGVPPPR
ncbi:hypothetical protein [Georgenia sp. Marseille-Q6866]